VSTPTTESASTEAPRPRKQEQEDAQVEVTEVAPGILRMQLPISFTGLGHVNCYAMEDRNGWTIVDPGLPGPKTMKALDQRLAQAGGKVKQVHTVIVTHSHPDHFGTAGYIRQHHGAQVVAHERFRTWFDPDEGDDVAAAAEARHTPVDPKARVPRATSAQIRERMGQTTPWGGEPPRPPTQGLKGQIMRLMARRYLKTPAPTVRLEDSEHVTLGGREWVALYTPGHTEDHLCLYDPSDGVVLSGDHVLPTITPHISGLGETDDSLADYVESLDRMAALPDVSVALPAHGHPFHDLPGRVEDIKRHHEERLDVLREATERLGPATVEDLSHEMFRERSWGPMAESETYAHLEHLRLLGEAKAEPHDDGLLYFHLT
jgi:glyoxylase-like metal-dependent hydrolase (beta-lactamase superfamily II)